MKFLLEPISSRIDEVLTEDLQVSLLFFSINNERANQFLTLKSEDLIVVKNYLEIRVWKFFSRGNANWIFFFFLYLRKNINQMYINITSRTIVCVKIKNKKVLSNMSSVERITIKICTMFSKFHELDHTFRTTKTFRITMQKAGNCAVCVTFSFYRTKRIDWSNGLRMYTSKLNRIHYFQKSHSRNFQKFLTKFPDTQIDLFVINYLNLNISHFHWNICKCITNISTLKRRSNLISTCLSSDRSRWHFL